jgi:hypothetical protein
MIALADTHARFSHLERFLREGDLLPGPDRHRWSKENPAYEFSTRSPARVLVRKSRVEPRWLITAWAADGQAREVSVDIPDLGPVSLEARPEGTVAVGHRGADGPLIEVIGWRERT